MAIVATPTGRPVSMGEAGTGAAEKSVTLNVPEARMRAAYGSGRQRVLVLGPLDHPDQLSKQHQLGAEQEPLPQSTEVAEGGLQWAQVAGQEQHQQRRRHESPGIQGLPFRDS